MSKKKILLGKGPLFEISDSNTYFKMHSLNVPLWILSGDFDSSEVLALAYILYRVNGGDGKVLISYRALGHVARCAKTSTYKLVHSLQDRGYIRIQATNNGGGPIMFMLGERAIESMSKDSRQKTYPIQKMSPLPIQKMNPSDSNSEHPPFRKHVPPIQKMNPIIKEIEIKNRVEPLFPFSCSKNTEMFKVLVSTPKWENMPEVSVRTNYEILRAKEKTDPFLVYAAMEYSLLHDYAGVHLQNKDVLKRAIELELEQAEDKTRQRLTQKSIPETDDNFYFMSGKPQSQYQQGIKKKWGECRSIIPQDQPELLEEFYSRQVRFERKEDILLIFVPVRLYEFLSGEKMSPFENIKYELKPII